MGWYPCFILQYINNIISLSHAFMASHENSAIIFIFVPLHVIKIFFLSFVFNSLNMICLCMLCFALFGLFCFCLLVFSHLLLSLGIYCLAYVINVRKFSAIIFSLILKRFLLPNSLSLFLLEFKLCHTSWYFQVL